MYSAPFYLYIQEKREIAPRGKIGGAHPGLVLRPDKTFFSSHRGEIVLGRKRSDYRKISSPLWTFQQHFKFYLQGEKVPLKRSIFLSSPWIIRTNKKLSGKARSSKLSTVSFLKRPKEYSNQNMSKGNITSSVIRTGVWINIKGQVE